MRAPPAPLVPQFDLSGRNTLGLRSRASYGGVLADEGEMIAAAQFADRVGLPFHLLGGGSNCLLAEEIDAVVGIAGARGRRLQRVGGGVRVTARAGETWDDIVRWTVGQGFGGLENLAGIPGTAGAAPIQNIGAFGVELSDVAESVDVIDTEDWTQRRLAAAECGFGYRQSRFKEDPGRFLVTGITLYLPAAWRPVLSHEGLSRGGLSGGASLTGAAQVMGAVLARRGERLPDWRLTGNAGSFFHNPVVPVAAAARIPDVCGHPAPGGVKLPAGKLLDLCGFRGRRRGGAAFSEINALILVNAGGATLRDVDALAARAQDAVRLRFGVDLFQEPSRVGN
ncbi:UDP-N-acetylmuramate dehydrogenase [Rhodovulum sulfidophilum]|uniref:UDP-N-acetylmuramate dehydrogenase n=1 Tax=Rhodovulum sulfidophilum TaxID=35806 RepID=UPI001F2A7FA7|nr:UDP-N-acetylmuramate dehydrogenase [Rhodovulum sulfidophilum]MCE8438440.1 UDP-N-acetylmuramate dehydrogenase [Rhodovulum sulfidophilum]